MIGSGIGGLHGIAETAVVLHEKAAPRLAVLHSRPPDQSGERPAYRSSITLKGPNHLVVTACSTGARTRSATRSAPTALGDANVMVAGGAESAVNRLGLAGFAACRAWPTSFNDRLQQGSRPCRSRPRRLRQGGRRRLRGARDLEYAEARENLRRSDRLWAFRRRLPHRPAAPDGDGACAIVRCAQTQGRHFRNRLRQRAWHLHAGRR